MARTLAVFALVFLLSALPARAEVLSFENVLSAAQAQDYDTKLARVDVRISHNEVRRACTDYFPTVRAQANFEYLRDLSGGTTPVAVVGTSVIPNTTRWQTALYLGASYNVFDFGLRGKVLQAARRQRDAARCVVLQSRRDVKLKVIDAYSDTLLAFQALKAKERILDIQHQLFDMKQRLFRAGKITKVEAAEQALELAKTFDEIHGLRRDLAGSLKVLSAFTHREYNPADVEVMPFHEERDALPSVFAVETMPEYRLYASQIESKKQELAAIKLQRLPQFSLYSNFYLYGFNQNDPFRAISDFRGRTIAFGVSASLPVFDGFKNMVEREKKKLEITRLEIERDKRLWDLGQDHARLSVASRLYQAQVQSKEGVVAQKSQTVVMVKRLADSELAEKTQYLSQQRDLIERQLELDRTQVQCIASLKKLRALTEG